MNEAELERFVIYCKRLIAMNEGLQAQAMWIATLGVARRQLARVKRS